MGRGTVLWQDYDILRAFNGLFTDITFLGFYFQFIFV